MANDLADERRESRKNFQNRRERESKEKWRLIKENPIFLKERKKTKGENFFKGKRRAKRRERIGRERERGGGER